MILVDVCTEMMTVRRRDQKYFEKKNPEYCHKTVTFLNIIIEAFILKKCLLQPYIIFSPIVRSIIYLSTCKVLKKFTKFYKYQLWLMN